MSEHITEHPAAKRLERSRSDRMIAGVCGGLAHYFDLSPVFFRVGFVVLTLLGGAGVLIYAAAALVIPDEGRTDSIAAEILRARRERPVALIGLAIVAVAGTVLLSRATLWPHGDTAWILLLIAGAIILSATYRRSHTAAAPAAGTDVTQPQRRPLRTLAIVSGVLLILALGAAAAFATIFHVDIRNGIGNRTYEPAGPGDIHRHYRLGVGNLRIDLGTLHLPRGETDVDARVGVGNLRVIVPPDVALRVKAGAQIGAVHVLDRHSAGRDAHVTVQTDAARVLVLDAHVGVGNVDVTRSLR